MARPVLLQQASPQSSGISFTSRLLHPSSLSEFNGKTFRISIQSKSKAWKSNGSCSQLITASSSKKILIMGGTRFIGVFLTRLLVNEGHQVTLFTRGKAPITQQLPGESLQEYEEYKSSVLHLKGDRKDSDFVKSSLASLNFEVVYDINGRESVEAEPILEALPNLEQYIYCSSAGVYLKSDLMPHFESDAVDPASRHKGKLETESVLDFKGVNWTSIRPVYIYGPLNYNPIEEWFFHRLNAGRPIPIPNSGVQITQLGHVKDLASAFVKVLGNSKASKQVYNISGSKYVTFDGLARACAEAAGYPEPEIVHYNPKEFDFGKKKAFPFRDQHFFASIEKAQAELNWKPEFGLIDGLRDSYNLDFGRGTYRKEADFSADDIILGKSLLLLSPAHNDAHTPLAYDIGVLPLANISTGYIDGDGPGNEDSPPLLIGSTPSGSYYTLNSATIIVAISRLVANPLVTLDLRLSSQPGPLLGRTRPLHRATARPQHAHARGRTASRVYARGCTVARLRARPRGQKALPRCRAARSSCNPGAAQSHRRALPCARPYGHAPPPRVRTAARSLGRASDPIGCVAGLFGRAAGPLLSLGQPSGQPPLAARSAPAGRPLVRRPTSVTRSPLPRPRNLHTLSSA
ncbi:hypothetical protein KSP39_PZI003146 [Platanthera zijinensis]|uniref:NAD-dependent epimerase/dehydratase domain-containing protein n=1 Tax=Platanthera zijinensis TaxID=2320716 RepID=A0AAP0BWJ6_9ASPA